MSEVKLRFTVKRKSWIRGKGANFSALAVLQTPDFSYKFCCLGFMCQAQGWSIKGGRWAHESRMTSKTLPFNVTLPHVIGEDRLLSPSEQMDIAAINDNESIADTEREERLKELFREHNIEVEFV